MKKESNFSTHKSTNIGSAAPFLIVGVLLILMVSALPLNATEITLPGKISQICFYFNLFYNFPNSDFIYYFNDQLLFIDGLKEDLNKTRYRRRVFDLLDQYRQIKEFLNRHKQSQTAENSITLDLKDRVQQKAAKELCSLLGLQFLINNKRFIVVPDLGRKDRRYYKFALLKPRMIQAQMNNSGKFYFTLEESKINIPWDIAELTKMSGLKLTPENFFEYMVKDSRFSLLLASLFRLSEPEINFINSCPAGKNDSPWEILRGSKKTLSGFFILSRALRVNQGHLVLPGGEKAARVWSELAEADPQKEPLQFLINLATLNEGKLNYLYVFSFFLPDQMQQKWFINSNIKDIKKIYDEINLHKNERVTGENIPELENFNPYILLHALQLKDNQVYFPGGIELWYNSLAFGIDKPWPKKSSADKPTLFKLISLLLKNNERGNLFLRSFISVYSKFQDRAPLVTRATLPRILTYFIPYNILFDFIEKIPLKDPQAISHLIRCVKTLQILKSEEKELFSVLYQCLLELMATAANYGNDTIDYDLIIKKMASLPTSNVGVYNGVLDILNKDLAIRPTNSERHFFHFLLGRLFDLDIQYKKNYYLYPIRRQFQKTIQDICRSQEVCSFTSLLQINELLSQIDTSKKLPPAGQAKLEEMIDKLPVAEISEIAPEWIRKNFQPFRKKLINKRVTRLKEMLAQNAPADELRTLINQIRGDHLIYYLKDYLLAVVYAVNAKDAHLKALYNPNLIRLHDFGSFDGRTPWNYSEITFGSRRLDSFHLRGGLSRLNIPFASSYVEQYLGRNFIYNAQHVEGIIYNFLDLFPVPGIKEADTYMAQLIDFGLELIQQGRENDTLRPRVLAAMGKITAGYHYHRIYRYLHRQSQSHNLFLGEICRLGESFLHQHQSIGQFSTLPPLLKRRQSQDQDNLAREMDRLGSLYYRTLGTLKPRNNPYLPLDLSTLFRLGSTSGELMREFKVNITYHAVKRKLSPTLLGQVMLTYFTQTFSKYFNQNYKQDFFSGSFLFSIINSSYLDRVIWQLKKGGQLILK